MIEIIYFFTVWVLSAISAVMFFSNSLDDFINRLKKPNLTGAFASWGFSAFFHVPFMLLHLYDVKTWWGLLLGLIPMAYWIYMVVRSVLNWKEKK